MAFFYQSFGCYQEFTLHCRNLNVGWFSPYLPIFRVVEWTYISLKISRFRKKISRAPFQLGSSGEAGVVGGREGPPSSTPNTSIHPQIDSCPKSKMVSLQNATRLLFITFFLEKKLKTPFYRKNTLEKGPNPLNHPTGTQPSVFPRKGPTVA